MALSWTDQSTKSHRQPPRLPRTQHDTLTVRHNEQNLTSGQGYHPRHQQLIWYFAYGSNMSSAKFTHSRGIIPVATANVELPGWCLTMEVPGLPYIEPGMASIARHEDLYPPSPRRPAKRATGGLDFPTPSAATGSTADQKKDDDLWVEEKVPASRRQGVVGVAYLVTQQQYVSIVRSEGGGIAYDDVELDAVGIAERDREVLSRHGGDGEGNVKVRTLVNVPSMSRRGREPLPSDRYKRLLVTGAAEAGLPQGYQDMLQQWPVFVAPARRVMSSVRASVEDHGEEDGDGDDGDDDRTLKRWIGALIFLAIWTPLLAGMERLTYRYISDETGLVPKWVKLVVRAAVWMIWWNHDVGFAPIFGRGDGREDLDQAMQTSVFRANRRPRRHATGQTHALVDCEKRWLPDTGESVSRPQGPEMAKSKRAKRVFWTFLS